MSLRVCKFQIEDYFAIERRSFDAITFNNFPNPRAIARTLASGPSFSIINGKSIIASGGLVPFWKGVGEAWLVSSDLVSEHGVWFAKTVLRVLDRISAGYDRVQTTVDAEHKMSIKWVEWMGFENEGLMRKYIGGRDFWRYARVRG